MAEAQTHPSEDNALGCRHLLSHLTKGLHHAWGESRS